MVALFAASRFKRSCANDADGLRKYPAGFGTIGRGSQSGPVTPLRACGGGNGRDSRLRGARAGLGRVGLQHLLPIVERDLADRRWPGRDAGIVEQEVDPPEAGRRVSEQARTEASSVTSQVAAARVPPPSARTASSGSRRRPATRTFQPASARAKAAARPTPLPPPVTIALPVTPLLKCIDIRLQSALRFGF